MRRPVSALLRVLQMAGLVDVLRATCEPHGSTLEAVLEGGRARTTAAARRACFAALRGAPHGLPHNVIANLLGCVSSSVTHGLQTAEQREARCLANKVRRALREAA